MFWKYRHSYTFLALLVMFVPYIMLLYSRKGVQFQHNYQNVSHTMKTTVQNIVFKENDKQLYQTVKVVKAVKAYPGPCIQETNCHLPDCFCFGIDDYPSDFQRHEVPQIVIFTTDDSLTPQYAEFYNQIFADHKNPNGCPFTGTMFISATDKAHDFKLVREFYDKGWEIGQHGFDHLKHKNTDVLEQDAKKMMMLTHNKTGIPFSEFRGWRSPYLHSLGNGEIRTLRRLNFTYSMTFSSSDAWPFTLDYEQFDPSKTRPKLKSSPGFWIIPNTWYDARPYATGWVNYVDDTAASYSKTKKSNNASEIERILDAAFAMHYYGDRSPLAVNTHGHLFERNPEALTAMINFFHKLDTYDDVFVITAYKALQWTRSPAKLKDIHMFSPWQC